jgi:signal transduction histidine kinase
MSDVIEGDLKYFDPSELGTAGADFSGSEERVLDEVNRRVAAAGSLEELLDFLYAETAAISPTDRLSVAFIEPGERAVSHTVRSGYHQQHLGPGYSEGLTGSSLQEVVVSGRVRVINDLEAYARAHPASRSTRLILAEGLNSSMTCPLSVEGRNVGLFWRSAKRPNAYDQHQVALHLAVAERLGQAVEKAYRIAELAAATRAYAEMLGFVSHELKSPIASMMTDVNLILGGYLGEVEPRQRQKLEAMLRKGEFLTRLVGEYLDLARVEAGELQPRWELVDDFAAKVIAPAIELLRGQFEARGQQLRDELPAKPLIVECDPGLLGVVAVNYLSNAAKYGDDAGEVRAVLSCSGGRLRFSVRNSGPGFPAEERGKLFRRFSRLDTPELKKRKGTGVGLYTCARLVALHHGQVGADSEPGKWAEFWFEMPVKRDHG